MHREMKIMSDLPVADVVPSSALTEDQRSKALDSPGFTDEKGLEIGSRLSAKRLRTVDTRSGRHIRFNSSTHDS